MSCEKHTSKTKQVLSQNGSVLPEGESKRITIKSIEAKLSNRERLSDAELQKLSQSAQKEKIIFKAIDNGCRFTVEEILQLENPEYRDGETLSHYMVWRGHKFTVDELLQLGNPAYTVAHLMANKGHKYSVEEILQLGNPIDTKGWSVAHFMAIRGHKFTVDEILRLENPIDKKGNTIAHKMAIKGHKFTVEDILQLGNPVSFDGHTIPQLMEDKGYTFTPMENFMSTSGFTNIQEAELAWRIEQGEDISMADVFQHPDLLERYADRLV